MMNPLDALSAMTGAQNPLGGVQNALQAGEAQLPAQAANGPANAITENFNLLQPALTSSAAAPAASPISGSASPATWGHMVQQMVLDVNAKQQDAASKVNDVLAGGPTPVHDAMISTEEASLSFEFLSEVRNKVVEAYQQVMQMQV